MTLSPRPSAEGDGLDMVYDAWNRLVAVHGCAAEGLAGYWNFDDGQGAAATDSSGSGADGTLYGPTWTGDGHAGGALDFDGTDDYVYVADDGLNSEYVTVACWVKADTATPANNMFVLNRYNANPGTVGLFLNAGNGKWAADVRLDGSEGTAQIVYSDAVATTDWTFLAVTYDGTTLRFYVNGVLQTSTAVSGTIDTDYYSGCYIGKNPVYGQYFDGLIDDIRVYDRALLADEIAALSGSTRYAYDAAGNLTSVTDPLGHQTQYEYDALGRVTHVADAEQGHTYYGYDALGNLLWTTDALGSAPVNGVPDANHTTFYEYDALGRLVLETDAEGGETSYTYDAAGNLLSLTDPEQNVTAWTYDGLGHVITETNHLGHTRYYSYDAAGRLIETTDRNDRVTQYEYDALNRLTEETWLDEAGIGVYTISYTYDALGDLLTASDIGATYGYEYDALGRLTWETQTIDGLTPTIVFDSVYNANGQRTELSATIGGTVDFVNTYAYDPLGRLTMLTQTDNSGYTVADKRIDFTYDAAGRYSTIARYADLAATQEVAVATYTFDDINRLKDLVYTNSTPSTIRSFGWTYDAAGNVVSHDSDIAAEDVTDYGYDNTNQLTDADYTTSSDESYTYDSNGNRVLVDGTDSYTTGDDNRLISDGHFRYEYDAEGNLIYRYVDADSSETLNANDTDITAYTWDHRNRLTEVAHKAVFGGAVDWTAEYVYDCFNRRIASLYDLDGDSALDREERYVWEGRNVVFDFIDADGDGETSSLELTTRYLWGQAVDQLFAQETVDDGRAQDVFWPITDNLGSVRSLVDYTGTITATYSYDTFGNVSVQAGTITDTRYHFTGQEYDVVIGDYYYDARWYDPVIGRFISVDPALDGTNLYRYVGNAPLTNTDPLGLCKEDGGYSNLLYRGEDAGITAAPFHIGAYAGQQMWAFANYNDLVYRGEDMGIEATPYRIGAFAGIPMAIYAEYNDLVYRGEAVKMAATPFRPSDYAGQQTLSYAAYNTLMYHGGDNGVTTGPYRASDYGGSNNIALVNDERFPAYTSVVIVKAVVVPASSAAESEPEPYVPRVRWRLRNGDILALDPDAKVIEYPDGSYTIVRPGRKPITRRPGEDEASFAELYFYYLRHPEKMDADLQEGKAFSDAMITIGTTGLSMMNPCAVGGFASLAIRGANAYMGYQNAKGFVSNMEQGNYVSAGLNALGFAGNVFQVLRPCFAAGTPLLTPTGAKPIEQFQPGDLVLSAPDNDPEAPVVAKRVEEVFQRGIGRLIELRVGGQTIRTTHEHPFYVDSKALGKKWLAACALCPGDALLRSHDGKWVPVESVSDTDEDVTVYNMRIEEYHTYFVGDTHWGFSVLSHNANCVPTWRGGLRNAMGEPAFPGAQAHHDLPWKWKDWFWENGFNVNDPAYGRWVGQGHQSWSGAFNDAWEEFIGSNPTRDQIIDFWKWIRRQPVYQ